jgi:hypothetical protein
VSESNSNLNAEGLSATARPNSQAQQMPGQVKAKKKSRWPLERKATVATVVIAFLGLPPAYRAFFDDDPTVSGKIDIASLPKRTAEVNGGTLIIRG